ncbi:hypothetical protein K7X08_013599 [Anisodus acutangulus]|uniref:Plasma membrane ATPase n=1 Tax=Anisodus acutangulus TaxID=402998 RepID=A0A9Q1R3H6_9SOLA|nr:hypothetical protein K7X08_013599 [Anisodus acutangulus]
MHLMKKTFKVSSTCSSESVSVEWGNAVMRSVAKKPNAQETDASNPTDVTLHIGSDAVVKALPLTNKSKTKMSALTGESLPVTKKTEDEVSVDLPVNMEKLKLWSGINNLLVLLIGGIPIAMPTVLSVTLAIGSHQLSQQGAITKRMTAIEEMAGMDVLCSDKIGTLTLNRLTVDRNLIEKWTKIWLCYLLRERQDWKIRMLLMQQIINMLADPKEACANIRQVHFLPFNPVDKRTAITYIDSDGNWYRVSKGASKQILGLCQEKQQISAKVHAIIDKLAERGLRSLAVAFQEIPEESMESPAGTWTFCGLLPLFDPPRHDTAETIHIALNLGVCVKMITDHKFEIVKNLQAKEHVVGMTGEGVNDAPALKKADIGIPVADSTDAASSAADLVLTEPGLSVIDGAVLTSRAIFQRMKNYTIYAVSITIRIVLGFMLLALIWVYDFPPFMVLIIAILNDGTIMTISQDCVKPSPTPDSWKLNEIFAAGIVIGTYLALVTVLFYWLADSTQFFETTSM